MKITKRQLKRIIKEEKLRMSIRDILTEALRFGEWQFNMNDPSMVGDRAPYPIPIHPSLKDYDGLHKSGKYLIGDLGVSVRPQKLRDRDGDGEVYNIGYIIEADDSAPAGGGSVGSKRRYVGHDGKAYRLFEKLPFTRLAEFQTFGSFDKALEAANKYIAQYMKEKGLKPGQGQSDEMKAKLDAHARYFNYRGDAS